MNKSPAFQFYAADFLSDENVVLMTNQEVGCYVKLLCREWIEGSIPNDVNKIAKLCDEDRSAMGQLWLAIRSCFVEVPNNPDRLINPRMEEVRRKQEEYKKGRVESGSKGGKARWQKAQNEESKDSLPIGDLKPTYSEPMTDLIANDSSSTLSSSSSLIDKDIHTLPKTRRKKEPQFGEEARTLASVLYGKLKDRNALPADKAFFVKQANIAQGLLEHHTLSEWLACLDWGMEDNFHSTRLSSLKYLGETVWPQYARRQTITKPQQPVSSLPGYMGNSVSDVLAKIQQIQGGGK